MVAFIAINMLKFSVLNKEDIVPELSDTNMHKNDCKLNVNL